MSHDATLSSDIAPTVPVGISNFPTLPVLLLNAIFLHSDEQYLPLEISLENPALQISQAKAYIPPEYAYSTAKSSVYSSTSTRQISPKIGQAAAQYVREQAVKAGLNPNILLFILAHESQNGVNMRGDDGQSRGYWMISKIWHPEVSTACADDLKCSTAWTIKRILAGYINEWSTWKYRCAWYKDAPNCPPVEN
ncbi:MAG: hypothetical protein KGL39_49635 [Patescibacteria group bacterium]|nr:hypothetical protein [Patescibacteria group bacterium]